MRKNGRTLRQDMGIVRRGIREFGRILPGQMGHVMVRSILIAGIPFLETAVTAVLLNGLTVSPDRGRLFLYAILGAGLILALSLWRNYEDCRIDAGYRRLFASHEIGLTGKAYALPYELLERDSTRRLRDEVSGAIGLSGAGMASLYWDMDVVWTNLFTAGMGAVILVASLAGMLSADRAGGSLGLAGLAALAGFSSFVACRMTGKRFDVTFELFLKGARYARYGDYYHMNYLPDEDAAMDARIYSQERMILDQCQTKCYERLAEGKEREYNAASRYDGVKLGCSIVCGCAVYLAVGRGAMEGAVGCGSVILLYSAVTRLIEAVARMAEILTDLRNNNEHLLRYFRYMDLPEARESGGVRGMSEGQKSFVAGKPDGGGGSGCDIVFQNVSFRYPDSDAYALKDVNLRLCAGEKTVIVGENGSGKTTLVKLLCRLYRPASGSILLNGRDIWDYDYGMWPAPESMRESACWRRWRRSGFRGWWPDTRKESRSPCSMTSMRRAWTSPAGRPRSWPSPGPSTRTQASWYWTSPPPRWTLMRSMRYTRISGSSRRGRPSCSSATGCPPAGCATG